MFHLHPQLQQDCEQVGRFELCQLLLMRDAHYPWCILVPARADISDGLKRARQGAAAAKDFSKAVEANRGVRRHRRPGLSRGRDA